MPGTRTVEGMKKYLDFSCQGLILPGLKLIDLSFVTSTNNLLEREANLTSKIDGLKVGQEFVDSIRGQDFCDIFISEETESEMREDARGLKKLGRHLRKKRDSTQYKGSYKELGDLSIKLGNSKVKLLDEWLGKFGQKNYFGFSQEQKFVKVLKGVTKIAKMEGVIRGHEDYDEFGQRVLTRNEKNDAGNFARALTLSYEMPVKILTADSDFLRLSKTFYKDPPRYAGYGGFSLPEHPVDIIYNGTVTSGLYVLEAGCQEVPLSDRYLELQEKLCAT